MHSIFTLLYDIYDFLVDLFLVAPKLYKVEAREIKARLETDIVRTVLQLGYDSKIVRGAIEHRLKTTGMVERLLNLV